MTNTYFFTGFPGFIATSLIKQLIRNQYEIEHIHLLVQPNFVEKAKVEIEKIANEESISLNQFTIIPGDITNASLNLSPETSSVLQETITHVFHLAAIYDLAVPEDIAHNVNVIGTQNINSWVRQLNNLKRYIYFSTAYVSGNREGVILETELEMNQTFKNHYERTKYEAEVLVQQIKHDVPTTIIRPGIVKGHSKTGATTKFDGPYFVLNFFDKLRFLPFIPYLGSGEAEGNFVPVDYIFNATLYLSHAEIGAGKTYHLTDPKPYSINEVYKMIMEKFLAKSPKGKIPLSLAKHFLSVSTFRKWLGVEKEALDYFTCKSRYDCTQAQQDLQDSGIACPDFKETLDSMVEFYEKHKNDADKQLVIR
jgi:nucleoside-diphosphate-sugar epimerase